MRTTLTIDDDLAGLLQRRAQELGLPFKEVVNRVLRQGLAEVARSPRSSRVKTRPHSFGFKPGIDLDRLNHLADQLETEAIRDRHLSRQA
jgi:hypothetical protein